jgi:uncharacterized protein Yka (UPF0111/DUF47 family)
MNNGWNIGLTIQIISLVLTVCIIPLIKILFSREVKRFEEKVAENKKQIEDLKTNMDQKVEKIKDDMNDMKNDMPFIYVTREDFIRSIDNVDKSVTSCTQMVNKVYEHLTQRKGE